jgi:choline dehydrogenase
MYRTQPEAGLNGRSLAYPRGKTLGGCSSINGMLFLRGQREDWDGWAGKLADPAWGWSSVLPLSRRHERHWKGTSGLHGGDGELHVQKQRLQWPILDLLKEGAARALHLPHVDDFNTGSNEGVGYFEVNQRGGRRWSAADAFLFKPPPPASEGEWQVTQYVKEALWLAARGGNPAHSNLTIMPGCVVDRLTFDGTRCTGVQARNAAMGMTVGSDAAASSGVPIDDDGTASATFTLDDSPHATVILSAGAVASPCILMRSGIGRAEELSKHGIKAKLDVPHIGRHLQDHLQIRTIFRVPAAGRYSTLNTRVRSPFHLASMAADYALRGSGPLAMAPSQLGAFARSNSSVKRANVEFHIQPLSLDAFGKPLHAYDAVTVSVCNLRPDSTGTIRLGSASPHVAPEIRPNYLSTDSDRIVAAESIGLARRVMAESSVVEALQPEEQLPGASLQSLGELAKAAGDISSTIFHPTCTVRMGRTDRDGALTPEMELRGTTRVRVCDASAMPSITSGNTNEPVLIMAERLADILCPV